MNLFQRIADFIKGKTRASTHSVLEQNKSVLYEETDPTGKVIAIRSQRDQNMMAEAKMNGISFQEVKKHYDLQLEGVKAFYEAVHPLGNSVIIKSQRDKNIMAEANMNGISFEEVKKHYDQQL